MYGFMETQGTFVAITNEGFLKLRPLVGDDRIITSGEIVPKVLHDL